MMWWWFDYRFFREQSWLRDTNSKITGPEEICSTRSTTVLDPPISYWSNAFLSFCLSCLLVSRSTRVECTRLPELKQEKRTWIGQPILSTAIAVIACFHNACIFFLLDWERGEERNRWSSRDASVEVRLIFYFFSVTICLGTVHPSACPGTRVSNLRKFLTRVLRVILIGYLPDVSTLWIRRGGNF